ncbi:MAG: VOC family protein [Pseudonocardiaceae bacterium]|nr:VOC family protein [Pseudonocardiaceae bacterium]
MEKVTGFGGAFFRANDPLALAHWYRDHLGVDSGLDGETVWEQQAGPTVFAPFPTDNEKFGPDQQVMFNFRVRDLDGMMAQLTAAGIDASEVEAYDHGRFAWITDPEGNNIELWEPPS